MWPHRPREDLLDALSGRKRQRGSMVRTESGRRELVHPGRQGGPARVGSVPQSVASAPGFGVQARPDRTAMGGHSHRVELGRVWGWGHLGRCPCHMSQLWPLLVRRGPRLFRGHLVRCRPPEFRLREGAPGRREYQRGGLPNLDAEDARVKPWSCLTWTFLL